MGLPRNVTSQCRDEARFSFVGWKNWRVPCSGRMLFCVVGNRMLNSLDPSPELAIVFCLAWRAKAHVVTEAPQPTPPLLSSEPAPLLPRASRPAGDGRSISAAEGWETVTHCRHGNGPR